jgi:hypothetical protein
MVILISLNESSFWKALEMTIWAIRKLFTMHLAGSAICWLAGFRFTTVGADPVSTNAEYFLDNWNLACLDCSIRTKRLGNFLIDQCLFLSRFCWFTAYTFGPISGLCLSLMSIDRVIAVRFPLQAVLLCTTDRAKRAVAITYTTIITLNLHIFFLYEKDGR